MSNASGCIADVHTNCDRRYKTDSLNPESAAHRIAERCRRLFVFLKQLSKRSFVLLCGFGLLLAIGYNLPGARRANPFACQFLHSRDSAERLLLFRFCHDLLCREFNPLAIACAASYILWNNRNNLWSKDGRARVL